MAKSTVKEVRTIVLELSQEEAIILARALNNVDDRPVGSRGKALAILAALMAVGVNPK